jgi:hypothetical protein
MKKVAYLTVAAALTAGATINSPMAQTAVSSDGVVESTSGGLKFPDGTVQATTAIGNAAFVEDTGQVQCWDQDGNPRSCSGTGEDGDNQAGVNWPTPRFSDNGNGTVTDNLTDLIWLKTADCFGLETWQQALSDANTLSTGECGLGDGSEDGDWRLPNIKELLSLVDYSQVNPAIPSGHPFSDVTSDFYWSSTSSAVGGGADNAWVVNFSMGDDGDEDKNFPYHVWPVRGGQ